MFHLPDGQSLSLINTAATTALLRVVRYLQAEMHYFRYEGERDWLAYHTNKPYESSPDIACSTRVPYRSLSPSLTLPWMSSLSSVNLPHYCGRALIAEKARHCACEFHQCTQQWTTPLSGGSTNAWMNHPIVSGLTHFAPHYGTTQSTLRDILKVTGFTDVCEGGPTLVSAVDARTRSSIETVRQRERETVMACQYATLSLSTETLSDWPLSPALVLPTKLSGKKSLSPSLFPFARGDFYGSHWQRYCLSRIHFLDDTSVYLSTSSCASDMPVHTMNFHGLPRPHSVCPESLSRLEGGTNTTVVGKDHYLDDSVMLALLYWSMLPTGK